MNWTVESVGHALLVISALACVPPLALAIDHWLGEPPAPAHPVVWMGRALGWCGERLAPLSPKARDYKGFWLAALVWCVLAALVLIVSGGLQHAALMLPAPLAAVVLALLLKPLLAWRMLREEVLAVEDALARSLPEGRERLARLVSRDVEQLNALQVRESAIESLAENLNDSVVAPLFWFALLGLPGAALYRFANTADAMWGYPGMRGGRYWQWVGKWAARADDVLSWLPARITALLLAAAGRGLRWHKLRREAGKTPSPNSGWPMAAMALALGVRLGKPGVYTLNPKGRRAGPLQTRRAARLGGHAVMLITPVVAVLAGLRGWAGA
ncbi:MAG: adenosylcobinamide-phosphate synthase CbiB [Acidovorax sp.]|uniref:adenosylcobinamide-phosphate synthase CbiB n=1 Tax=Acidovorax sp. TaxID=1872122 RepID=UPI0039E68C91